MVEVGGLDGSSSSNSPSEWDFCILSLGFWVCTFGGGSGCGTLTGDNFLSSTTFPLLWDPVKIIGSRFVFI